MHMCRIISQNLRKGHVTVEVLAETIQLDRPKTRNRLRASGANQIGLHFDCDEAKGATLLLPRGLPWKVWSQGTDYINSRAAMGKRSSLTARGPVSKYLPVCVAERKAIK